MKKILIGTHNKGKFKEIAYLISKKYKKISPSSLNIKSPKETGKTFSANSKLKANYFSQFVNIPVISDDLRNMYQRFKRQTWDILSKACKKTWKFF